ncbi:MAG: hypothetical protein GXP58_09020, partial [Deltaproteobacteria bacterium]|nr:hypothetical protein [Deltaproteobacteria bacterium]
GVVPYRRGELEEGWKVFQKRMGISHYIGSRYLFILAPNKQSVYPEYLPSGIGERGGITRGDQLSKMLRRNGAAASFLDLRPLLRQAKKKYSRLYLKTDTHWNQRGAFLAYRAVVEKLQGNHSEPVLLDESALRIRRGPSKRGDLAEMMGVKPFLREETLFLSVKSPSARRDDDLANFLKRYDKRYSVKYKRPIANINPDGHLNVVLFRDSFSSDMIPYYAESFHRMVIYYEPFNTRLLYELVTQGKFHPDLIIEELIERSL